MAPAARCRLLADCLRRILTAGLSLNATALKYIDATFADPTADGLLAVLRDEADCERDSLLALLFTPEESTQERLETILERHRFHQADGDQVVDDLLNPPPTVTFRLPGDRGEFSLPLPSEGARRLVRLLHVEKRLPAVVRTSVDNLVDETQALRVKVTIRNARCALGHRKAAFLSNAVAKLDFSLPEDHACLLAALSLLEDFDDRTDFYGALMQRKRSLRLQMQAARTLDEQLRKSNPETMMLQGQRLGGIDVFEARRLVAAIDRLGMAIFGRTEESGLPAMAENLEATDAAAVFRLLI